MNKINKQLEAKIVEKFDTVKNFSAFLGKPPTTLYSMLKSSINATSASTIKQICDALDIDMYSLLEGKIENKVNTSYKLTHKELSLIEKYRGLDDFGVRAMDTLLSIEHERNVFYENEIPYLWKPCPFVGVAAGNGSYISDYVYQVKIPKNNISERSDYVVQVLGDSMEPDYNNQEYVLIRSQPDIDIGQVGIYILNGESYIKEKGYNSLISHNKKYKPIVINEYDDIRCCGLVLGKTEVLEQSDETT